MVGFSASVTCQLEALAAGGPYPKSCPTCGLGGRCVKGHPQPWLDRTRDEGVTLDQFPKTPNTVIPLNRLRWKSGILQEAYGITGGIGVWWVPVRTVAQDTPDFER